MAEEFKACSVDGCKGNAYHKASGARGMCRKHYNRWYHHGDPTIRLSPRGEIQEYYETVVLSYDGKECLIWPHARTMQGGYAKMTRGGKISHVSRFVCEDIYGPAPTDKHEAAHSCGNGHLACVAKSHLSWKTPSENAQDKLTHGTHNRGDRHVSSKLTESQVREIWRLRGKETQISLARRFGVSPVTIYKIYAGKKWGWLIPDLSFSSRTAS